MRIFVVLSLLSLLASCAHERSPASAQNQAIARDSIALGNVKATAVKVEQAQNVCFDISLVLKNVDQKEASPSNWTVAWIDHKSRYHLLSLNQRDPASIPQGGRKIAPYGYYEEWRNTFRTCAPKARMDEVKSIVLTPKELPYKHDQGLKLEWN